MRIEDFYGSDEEKPLDRLMNDGGFCGIFRTIGCIGDSLSSGEFESVSPEGVKGYHDYYDYSWGQFLARMCGSVVRNFSRGGMTAKEMCEGFGDTVKLWDVDHLCQAYILALGVNDIPRMPLGSLSDINCEDVTKNAATFAGYYAAIIQRLQKLQPQARFFLMTIPRTPTSDRAATEREDMHRALLEEMTRIFERTYLLDFRTHAPVYDAVFRKQFFLGGHMNPAGYLLTAKMVASYIDYWIRHCPEDFAQVGLIGTPYRNYQAKW